jgi:predicted anti-sigma-YlaC factor YlaD
VSAGGNETCRSNDYRGMKCEIAREALSAWLDGEQSVPGRAEVNAHVAGCGGCRSWQEGAHRLARQVWLKPARPMSDDTARILEAVIDDRAVRQRVHGPWRLRLVRAGLAAAAMAQFVIIIPALVFGHAGIGVPPQAAHELGAFNLALAVGFAAAALRPAHARGMRPLVGAATVCLIALSVIDTANGHTTLLAEVPHVIAVIGLVLLHMVAEPSPTATFRRWLSHVRGSSGVG